MRDIISVLAAILAACLAGCDAHSRNIDLHRELASCRPARTVAFAGELPIGQSVGSARYRSGEPAGGWMELGRSLNRPLLAGSGGQGGIPAVDAKPEPWRSRRGPAYKGEFWHSFGRDAKEMPATIWDDTKATFSNPWALAGLGLAAVSGVAVHKSGADDRTEDHYRKHRSQLSGFGDMIGDVGGNPATHFALAGAMYFASLGRDDLKGYETSKALINALAINGLTTLALKGIVRTESPNDEPFGWPSGHTSSTFCLATVMHEAYGPWVGVPLFAFAGFVGYERIDARNHDLSDVVSGAFIGVAIGHAVMQNHKPKILGFELNAWADPNSGAVGLALSKQF